jgi:hypothetical protein
LSAGTLFDALQQKLSMRFFVTGEKRSKQDANSMT